MKIKILFIAILGWTGFLNSQTCAQDVGTPRKVSEQAAVAAVPVVPPAVAETTPSSEPKNPVNQLPVEAIVINGGGGDAAPTDNRGERYSSLEKLREVLIIEKARTLRFKDPLKALAMVPPAAVTEMEIEGILRIKSKENPQLVRPLGFCSPDFAGEPYTFDVPTRVPLSTLLNDLRLRFGINFLTDDELSDLPIQATANDVPWNLLLQNQLFLLDIEATCLNDTTISLVKRQKLALLQESQRKTAPIRTEYIRLKFLRPSSQGQVNLAGRPSGGGATLESLELEIQKILRSSGDGRASVGRIPNTSELIIVGSDDQINRIKEIIEKADRPSYRVQVFALVYTVNENRLKDVGSQLSAVFGNGNLSRLGGLTTLPGGSQQGGSGTGGNTNPGAIVPGGVRSLGTGFSQPTNGLNAGAATTIFGGSVSVGTAQFAYQLSLLEQLGVARRVEKLRIETKDGTTGTFESGRQIPVIVQASNNLGGGAPGQLEFINAGSSLSVTPQVIEDSTNKPYLIDLDFRAESNNVDTSILTTGGVPSVNGRRVQSKTTFLLNQVYVLAASNDTTESTSLSRTPGLGQLPIIGEFFKRRTKQKSEDKLYFAFWVEVSYSDATSTIPTENLDQSFPVPPPTNAPLKIKKQK